MCVQTFRIEINSRRLDGNNNSKLERGTTIYHSIYTYNASEPVYNRLII